MKGGAAALGGSPKLELGNENKMSGGHGPPV
jgi:hypothetical protein